MYKGNVDSLKGKLDGTVDSSVSVIGAAPVLLFEMALDQ